MEVRRGTTIHQLCASLLSTLMIPQFQISFTDIKAFNGTPPIHMNNNNWTLLVC